MSDILHSIYTKSLSRQQTTEINYIENHILKFLDEGPVLEDLKEIINFYVLEIDSTYMKGILQNVKKRYIFSSTILTKGLNINNTIPYLDLFRNWTNQNQSNKHFISTTIYRVTIIFLVKINF